MAGKRDRGLYRRGRRWWLKWYLPGLGPQRLALVPAGQTRATADLQVARLLAAEIRASGLSARQVNDRRKGRPASRRKARSAGRGELGPLGALLGDYRAHNLRTAAPGQVDRNAAKIAAFLADQDISIAEQITAAAVEAHLRQLQADGLSPSTIAKGRAAISGFCRYLVVRGLLGRNPARDVRAPRVELPAPRWLREDEYRQAIELADAAGCGDEVRTALWTGMRKGELAALDWADVRWADRTIVLPTSKSGSPRAIPMPAELVELLARRRRNSGRVFHRSRNWWRTGLDPLREPMPVFRQVRGTGSAWHLLRHTYCSRLAAAAVALVKIKEWAGHASIATTMRYAHLAPGYDGDVEAVTGGGSQI